MAWSGRTRQPWGSTVFILLTRASAAASWVLRCCIGCIGCIATTPLVTTLVCAGAVTRRVAFMYGIHLTLSHPSLPCRLPLHKRHSVASWEGPCGPCIQRSQPHTQQVHGHSGGIYSQSHLQLLVLLLMHVLHYVYTTVQEVRTVGDQEVHRLEHTALVRDLREKAAQLTAAQGGRRAV